MLFLNKVYWASIWVGAAALLYACAPSVTKSTTATAYEEDISVHREKYPAPDFSNNDTPPEEPVEVLPPTKEPSRHIKSELDSVLLRIEKAKADINFINGLTIQIYSGNNREKANEIRKQVYEISDIYSPEISYDQPNYKVNVGKYFSRLEANKDYNILKKEFEEALLVPKRIPIQSTN